MILTPWCGYTIIPRVGAGIDKKARSTIILSLSDSVIREVAKENIVIGLWAKL